MVIANIGQAFGRSGGELGSDQKDIVEYTFE